jgi:hypothetical protein
MQTRSLGSQDGLCNPHFSIGVLLKMYPNRNFSAARELNVEE